MENGPHPDGKKEINDAFLYSGMAFINREF